MAITMPMAVHPGPTRSIDAELPQGGDEAAEDDGVSHQVHLHRFHAVLT